VVRVNVLFVIVVREKKKLKSIALRYDGVTFLKNVVVSYRERSYKGVRFSVHLHVMN
jgi:hypothetical protein